MKSVSKSTSLTSLSEVSEMRIRIILESKITALGRVEQVSFKDKTALEDCTRKYSHISASNLLASLLKVMNILKQVRASQFTGTSI